MKLQIRVSNNSANKCTVKGKLEKHVLHKRKVADFQVTLVASLSLALSLSLSISLSLSLPFLDNCFDRFLSVL